MISWVISDKAMLWILIDLFFLFNFIKNKERGKAIIEKTWDKTYNEVNKAEKAVQDILKKRTKAE